ncbi:MAG: biopolymer transporter ExbD [bacterium]
MAIGLRNQGRNKAHPVIPTASTGDVAFLIIIFFLATSIFSREKGLKIVLPEKGDAIKIKAENVLVVAVSQTGQVLLDNQVVNIPDVRGLIEQRIAANADIAIALRVSRSAPYQTMVEVFDQLKMAKAERISLAPVMEEEGGGG